jgi:zinc/manganese transport system substrate-binding protein
MKPFAVAALLAAVPILAAAQPRVVTTTEGLAAVAREIGGDRISVESLSRGTQDPHFVDANPLLALRLRNADLLVDVGVDLEIGWLPPLVLQSRNREIQPGRRGRLTAATVVELLDVPEGPVDRGLGDVHPGGNPHFLTDPRRAVEVAGAIAERLAELDPANAAGYRERLHSFRARMESARERWRAALAPAAGKKIFSHHRTLTYFLDWTGIVSAGELEPRPGVPPSPSHLAGLVQRARREDVRAVVVENYYSPRSGETVARLAGAKLVLIPGDVGGEPGLRTYEQYVDTLVSRIGGALR